MHEDVRYVKLGSLEFSDPKPHDRSKPVEQFTAMLRPGEFEASHRTRALGKL
ncbi:MAG: hypothetical protein HYX78_14645 [Armatimonadetes bacterium]|nr:hypothetical protein [Armatimonadota bacterium]